jgi:hypothetical protein
MSKNSSKTFPVGRDSKTGAFVPVKEAQRRPNTTTVERIPKSGYGDTPKELKSVIIKSSRRK